MHTPSDRLQKSSEGADREKRLGNLNGFTGGSFAGMVYHSEYLSPSLTTMGGGAGCHILW